MIDYLKIPSIYSILISMMFLELEQIIVELERRSLAENSVRRRVLIKEAIERLKKVKSLLDEEEKEKAMNKESKH